MNWFTPRKTRYKPGILHSLLSRPILDEETLSKASSIIESVKTRGDSALIEYLRDYHGTTSPVRVDESEVEEAYRSVPQRLIDALDKVKERIEKVARDTLPRGSESMLYPGLITGVKYEPVERVGVYAPGGLASYPSTVLMTGIPARVAGVKELYLATPPEENGRVDPLVLVAADMVGYDEIYRLGGAYAAAALALGTETVKKVDMIAGPGGKWFTAAKALLYGRVGVDFLAGPTELFIVADGSIEASWVAWDIAAQAEHSPDTTVILAVTSEDYADRVIEELSRIVARLETRGVVEESISRRGLVLLVEDLDEALRAANEYAPEHLYIAVENPSYRLLSQARNTGMITLGPYAPPALADYSTGANHVLPTMGWPRFTGGLTPACFLKPIYYVFTLRDGFRSACREAVLLSDWEGLKAHKMSVYVRGCDESG